MVPHPAVVRSVGSVVKVRSWRHEGQPTPLLPPSAHDAVELAWLDAGAARYHAGSRDFTLTPGVIVVVPYGVEHRTGFEPGLCGTALWITRTMFDEIASAMGPGSRELRFGIIPSDRALVLARLITQEASSNDEGHLLVLEALVEALVVEVLRGSRKDASPAVRDPRVNIALGRMRDAYAEDVSVDDLAKLAGMSRFHFSRLFREQVGEAPYRHLLQLRVARAAELLRSGRHSVTQVALEVGFRDMSRFSRAFRHAHGVNPGKFRARSA